MTIFPSPRRSLHRNRTGMALVVCLALLVLLTAVVLAFFARTMANQMVESSRTNRVKTELLSASAGDYTIGRFLQEISDPANSTVRTLDGQSVYYPKMASNAVPQRKIVGAISETDDIFLNLIRQSVPSADPNAATVSSAAPARNGRTIGPQRWNAPQLLGGAGFSSESQLPNWIYVNADGTVTNAVSKNAIGRFAYNAYNEGGLLDANVAGYPSSVSGTNLFAIKGTMAGADLTQLGLSPSSIDSLVAFRNPDATTAAGYTNNVLSSARDGFNFRSGQTYTNNLFTTRQDLIRYAQVQNPELTNALPYMSPFVRGLASPSFQPDASRPKVGSEDDRFNPSLLDIRVGKAFTRMDGSTAEIGEPLLKRRFPLRRLAWIGRNGPAAGATATQIEQAFGLVYQNGSWQYMHGSGDRLLTLEEVRDLPTGREPDFFELLQAGMLYGSLGKTGAGNTDIDKNPANQVLQVGANLIDQADENSFPTTISFNGTEFYGIENLPYLYRVFMTPYRFHGASQPSTQENVGIWFQPEIWNPHANAATPAPDAPTVFRFVATGQVVAAFGYMSDDSIPYPGGYRMGPVNTFSDPATDSGSGIRFSTTAANFSQPQPLRTDTGASASGADVVTDDGLQNFLGLHAGTVSAPDFRHTNDSEDAYYKYATVFFQTPVSFLLQYLEDGKWVTYSRISQVDVQAYDGERPPGNMFQTYNPASFYSLIDPRTDRFNMTVGFTELSPGDLRFGPNYNSGLTQRPTADIGAQRHGGVNAWPGWVLDGPNVVGALLGYFGTVSDNLPSSVCRYTDPDGVLRPADGAYTDGSLPEGYPLATNNWESRPVVLNRPFLSVAEMGFASRDMPWKHLDFFSKDSADAALLDLFCVEESSPAAQTPARPELEAGRIDLNTRQAKVLQALLANTPKSESNDTLSAADAATLAASLVARTTDPARGPLVNPSELVTKWAQDLSYGAKRDRVIKRRRETAIRALTDVGTTRTWNLLIDIVVQSGRIVPGSTSFQIEGEQRCWLHVIIDRPTGKVVSQFRELVYE